MAWKKKAKKRTEVEQESAVVEPTKISQVEINPEKPITLIEPAEIVIKPIDQKIFLKTKLFDQQSWDLDQKMILYLKATMSANGDWPILNWNEQVHDRKLLQVVAKVINNRNDELAIDGNDFEILKEHAIDVVFLEEWIKRYQTLMATIFVKFAPENANLTPKRQNKYLSQALVSSTTMMEKLHLLNNLKQLGSNQGEGNA